MIELDGTLSLDDVEAVARDGEQVRLSSEARADVQASRDVVEAVVEGEDRSVYGVNTGFGNLKDIDVDREYLREQQLNLLRSHHTSMGDPLPEELVRAALLVRANTLALGLSGVRPVLIDHLCTLLNEGVLPIVPARGSGDNVCSLSGVGLLLAGEGEAIVDGERVAATNALDDAGLEPLTFRAKEGLSLVSGTTLTTAIAALTVADLERLVAAADVAGAWTFALVGNEPGAFDERVFDQRPVDGHRTSAATVRDLLELDSIPDEPAEQDPLSIRTIPQVNGTLREFLADARAVVETELASATDNPLVFPDGTTRSCGNFNAQHVAGTLDRLGLATVTLGRASEKRAALLLSGIDDLERHLANEPGVESGLVRAHYTAASLVTDAATTDTASEKTFVASTGQEEIHAVGIPAAKNLRAITEQIREVVAIELLCCYRATTLASPPLPEPLENVVAAFDAHLDVTAGDQAWRPVIQTISSLVAADAIERATGR